MPRKSATDPKKLPSRSKCNKRGGAPVFIKQQSPADIPDPDDIPTDDEIAVRIEQERKTAEDARIQAAKDARIQAEADARIQAEADAKKIEDARKAAQEAAQEAAATKVTADAERAASSRQRIETIGNRLKQEREEEEKQLAADAAAKAASAAEAAARVRKPNALGMYKMQTDKDQEAIRAKKMQELITPAASSTPILPNFYPRTTGSVFPSKGGKKSKKPHRYEDFTVAELKQKASKRKIVGYSTMRKADLISALRK